MKQFRKTIRTAGAFVAMFALALLAGCETNHQFQDYGNMSGPFRPPTDTFHVGELVVITFYLPSSAEKTFPSHEERVKEDGYITPPDIGRIKAVGRTAGEIQKEVQEKYDKLYRNLTVTVKPGDRFYYVDGEVRQSGPKPYLGQTDVVSAIAAASGFTDFAKKNKIQLIHPNGKKEFINYNKAVEDPAENKSVYPNDKIIVPRRLF